LNSKIIAYAKAGTVGGGGGKTMEIKPTPAPPKRGLYSIPSGSCSISLSGRE
jgi:hypothetical protein